MATPNRLGVGLLLLGVLGVLQTPAPAQATLQPNFQEDKVRAPRLAQRRDGAHGEWGALHGKGEQRRKGWPGGRGLPRRFSDGQGRACERERALGRPAGHLRAHHP